MQPGPASMTAHGGVHTGHTACAAHGLWWHRRQANTPRPKPSDQPQHKIDTPVLDIQGVACVHTMLAHPCPLATVSTTFAVSMDSAPCAMQVACKLCCGCRHATHSAAWFIPTVRRTALTVITLYGRLHSSTQGYHMLVQPAACTRGLAVEAQPGITMQLQASPSTANAGAAQSRHGTAAHHMLR